MNTTGKVLVNCQMGMSRSSTCVLAYLILRHQMSADEALNTVSIKLVLSRASNKSLTEFKFVVTAMTGSRELFCQLCFFSSRKQSIFLHKM